MPSTASGLPYPALTDSPNGPVQIQALADALEPYIAKLGGIGPMASGSLTITPSAANTTTSAAVSFPAGRFSSGPTVIVSGYTGSSSAGTIWMSVWATGVTATGFTMNLNRSNTTTCALAWFAILTS